MFDRTDAVSEALGVFGGSFYLEIGVRTGAAFRQVRSGLKVGVDPAPLGRRLRLLRSITTAKARFRFDYGEHLYQCTSDDFFRTAGVVARRRIDVALIDGLHTAEQSLRDVYNCLDCGSDNIVLVLHDCNPQSDSSASSSLIEARKHPAYDGAWNGEVYKTIMTLRSTRSDLRVSVFDCDEGLGVVTRGTPDSMLNLSPEEINRMTYADLAGNREELLNLRGASQFSEFITGADRS